MPADLYQLLPDTRGVTVIELSLPEHLDSSEFDRLNEGLARAIAPAAGGRWVIDLSGVAYAGSAVLGLLINIRQQVKTARGRLVLCGLGPRLSHVFHTCCMERLFDIEKARADAVRLAGY